jgi:hypothetical protein
LFGGLGIYAVTQLHGLALKRWHKAVFIAVVLLAAGRYYAQHIDHLVEIPRVVAIRFNSTISSETRRIDRLRHSPRAAR